jgi:hypothetical protein
MIRWIPYAAMVLCLGLFATSLFAQVPFDTLWGAREQPFVSTSGGTITGTLTLTSDLKAKDGTASSPAIHGTTDTTDGIYWDGTNTYFGFNGSRAFDLRPGGVMCFGSSGDSCINRSAAGHFTLDNGGGGATSWSAGTFTTARTTGLTLTAGDAGNNFTNEGTTARVDFVLPSAPATGNNYCYRFFVQDADGIKITAAAGDTIRNAGSVSGTAGYICDAATIGNSITLCNINATEWYASGVAGTWTIDSGCP